MHTVCITAGQSIHVYLLILYSVTTLLWWIYIYLKKYAIKKKKKKREAILVFAHVEHMQVQ